MRPSLRATPILAMGLLALVLPLAASAAEPILQLNPWLDPAKNGLTFPPAEGQPDPAEGLTFEGGTDAGHYRWHLDLREPIQYSGDSRLRSYVVYLKNVHTGAVTRHKLQPRLTGTFEDQWARGIRFDVLHDPHRDAGEMDLPVSAGPPADPAADLDIRVARVPVPIRLGGVRRFRVTLHNKRKKMELVVHRFDLTPDDETLWVKPPAVAADQTSSPVIPANKSVDFIVELQPRLIEAVQRSMTLSGRDKEQGVVTATATFGNPYFEGVAAQLPREIAIRFEPGLVELLIALSGGVVLGSGLRLLRGSRTKRPDAIRSTAVAWLAALILSLVGVFMVSYGSKFVLFTFELDPRETLPTALIGIGCGLLGVEAATKVGFIKKDSKKDKDEEG